MASRTDEPRARSCYDGAHNYRDAMRDMMRDMAQVDSEDDMRVLTALIGCLMIADGGRRNRETPASAQSGEPEPQS
jgi:hypothetical protein